MLRMDFFEDFRLDGTWDRWCRVSQQYHREVAAMQRALDTPLGQISCLVSPELLVARLLEPVHVSSTLNLWCIHDARLLDCHQLATDVSAGMQTACNTPAGMARLHLV